MHSSIIIKISILSLGSSSVQKIGEIKPEDFPDTASY